MKRNIVLLLLLVLMVFPIAAQITHEGQDAVDKKAQDILKRAASLFDQSVSFSVKMTVFDGQHKQSFQQAATVKYNRGKYHLSAKDQEIICDGTTVWQWNKSAKEVSISNVGKDEIDLFNPANLLYNYQRSFRAKYIRSENGEAIIDLQPRSARNYHKIRLRINEKDKVIRSIEVHRFDSGRETYTIDRFSKASTADSQFRFDTSKHPDLEIIDLR